MHFYHDCLGGGLNLQTVGEAPMADQMPEGMAAYVLLATLRGNGLTLMASDMVGEQGLVQGNAVSLMLHCDSEESVRICYTKLSAGGLATQPLAETAQGALFGSLTDKFGHHWLLHFDESTH